MFGFQGVRLYHSLVAAALMLRIVHGETATLCQLSERRLTCPALRPWSFSPEQVLPWSFLVLQARKSPEQCARRRRGHDVSSSCYVKR
ncbi:hypothetical protein EDC04DRAFT_2734395 [Pisolithus marmoratus]|nr:hypothetical protein EDC04DRAFT_2734395 [Pisolithus marmoratus]